MMKAARGLLLLLLAPAAALLVFEPDVERVVINIGSNTQPALPHHEKTVAIAIEPMVGCKIRERPGLHVVHAAIAANDTLMFMNWFNKFGESSSLSTPTEVANWNTQWRKPPKIVNVISMKTLLAALDERVDLWYLKTDMQGFDFQAFVAGAHLVKERAHYVMTEVWWANFQSYNDLKNDFCKDHWPFFTALGFELVDVEDGYKTDQKGPGIEAALKPDGRILAADEIAAVCAGQRDLPPARPPASPSALLFSRSRSQVLGKSNEADAYWRRVGTPLEPPTWREGRENPRLRRR